MKILKGLSTLLIVMGFALGTTAFANSITFSGAEYNGSDDTITIKVGVIDSVTTIDSDASITIEYDSTKFSFKEASFATSDIDGSDYPNDSEYEVITNDVIDTSANKNLATITFNVIAADKNSVVGTEFGSYYLVYANDTKEKVTSYSFAVTAAGGQGGGSTVTATKGTASGDITPFTLSTGKKVMTKKFTSVSVLPTTRLVVTRNGESRDFGSDLYKKLGGQGGGAVSIGSLTFGLVVDSSAEASEFTFAIN